jgi:hypothetical protein
MFVQFSDATEVSIVAVFANPQGAETPNQGTVTPSDARWAAFYAMLPASVQASLTPPTTPVAPTLAQQANALLATSLAITSTATESLDATYPADPNTISYVNSELNAILLNDTFADGTNTIQWPDTTGALHTFTVAQFKTFAAALGAFVSGIRKCVIGATGAVLPPASATIP